jgi:hypothetical protein
VEEETMTSFYHGLFLEGRKCFKSLFYSFSKTILQKGL